MSSNAGAALLAATMGIALVVGGAAVGYRAGQSAAEEGDAPSSTVYSPDVESDATLLIAPEGYANVAWFCDGPDAIFTGEGTGALVVLETNWRCK